MSAAAHPFHHDLDINFVNGSGTDVNLVIIAGKNKRCLDSCDIEQLIGRLCTYNGRAFQTFTWASCNGKIIPVDLSSTDSLRSRLIGINIVTEHLAYTCHIRPASSQKCRSLKGTYTCPCCKVVGIDHDTRINTVRLNTSKLQPVCKILQDLRDHLTA